jgi:sugar lactone lactonase YvrE
MLLKQSALRVTPAICLTLAAAVLSGCGGGGGAGGSAAGGPPPPPPPTSASTGTATFQVDVATGKVQIVPSNAPAGALRARTVFGGSAVSFTSSVLSDQGGDTGVKVLNVSLTNHFSLPIGASPNGTVTGLKVVFSNFTDLAGLADIRSGTTVSTIAGTGIAGSTDGSAGSSSFRNPIATATAPGGIVYVADINNNKVRKFVSGSVSTLAGNGAASSVDGLGPLATLNRPTGMAVSPADGAVFVAEFSGNKIRRITPDGHVTTVAGTGAVGGANGVGTAATFNAPEGVAITAGGVIYITEATGNKVRKIVQTGGDPTLPASYTVSTLAGSGAAGTADGVGAAATFNHPIGIAYIDGSVYVCDQSTNRIRRISAVDGAVVTIAGTGVASAIDGSGLVATFNHPSGMTAVNGALIVSDDAGNRIRQITLSPGQSPTQRQSWQVQTIAGTGVAGAIDGAGNVATFNAPELISADSAGNIIIPNYGTHTIRRLVPNGGLFPVGVPTGSPSTSPVQLANADGNIPSTGDGLNVPYIEYAGKLDSGASSVAKPWWFIVPAGVTAFQFTVTVEASAGGLEPPTAGSGAGSPTAIVRTLAGVTNSTGFLDGTSAQARMGLIKYADIDAAGNVYFTDLSNNALRRITPGGIVTTLAGGPGNVATSADGTGATAKISSINAVAVTPDGATVFFGDGNLVRVATVPNYLDSSDAGSWTITTLGGTVSAGTTNGVLTNATFNTIEDFAWDPNAKVLYASEFFGNRIRRIMYKGGGYQSGANFQVSTLAGDDSGTNGAAGSTDSTGTSARLNNPRGIAVDRFGNVWFADQSNFKIRKITPLQQVITVAGSGVQGYGDGAGTDAGVKFSLAYGISVDSAGYVYVGDIGTFTVRRIDPAGVVTTVAGSPSAGSGIDGPGNVATFVRPAGLAISPSGDLVVCDQSSMRLIQRLVNTGTN